MVGIGTVINTVLVIIGSLVGLLLKKAIPERLKESMIQALALATFTIGVTGIINASSTVAKDGTLTGNYAILMVLSMAIGTFIGELINIQKKLDNMGDFLQKKFSSEDSSSFSQGFVTASLVFCVGSMTILGSINDALLHDPTILITKSILDMIMSVVFASTLGIGVIFSAATVALYQGILTACASFLSPILTGELIAQMSFVGSILIAGIGLNFIYKPKLKLANMLPAMFIPLIWYLISGLWR